MDPDPDNIFLHLNWTVKNHQGICLTFFGDLIYQLTFTLSVQLIISPQIESFFPVVMTTFPPRLTFLPGVFARRRRSPSLPACWRDGQSAAAMRPGARATGHATAKSGSIDLPFLNTRQNIIFAINVQNIIFAIHFKNIIFAICILKYALSLSSNRQFKMALENSLFVSSLS